MELLNKSVRAAARWRMVGVIALLVALSSSVMYAMNRAYQKIQDNELNQELQKLKELNSACASEHSSREVALKDLKAQIDDCLNDKSINRTIDSIQTELNFVKKELKNKQLQLDHCNRKRVHLQ